MKHCIKLVVCLFLIACNSKGKRSLVGESEYQIAQNAIFKDASKSPLKKKDLKNFKGLDFFPVDSNFIVTGKFTKIENAPVFEMSTTTDRKPLYKEYGTVEFQINNVACKLTIYQNQDDLNSEEYKDYLFLPFTDDTSGESSYGGGRYMDIMTYDIKADSTVVLNFNNTYNPYCAYNEKYSCPLTPRKNHLNVAITAGIKTFKK
ncbi:MAG: DUF1684 domain-containing protein [Polaribacter sp.]